MHARRPFFAMADIEENARRKAVGKKEIPLSPIAIEVVRRIDALFGIERSINGRSPEERLKVRRAESRPLVDDLKAYMREQAAKLSRGHDLVKAIHYMLKRWHAFTLSSTTGARACRTMPLSGGCAAWPSNGSRGCSADPTAGAGSPQTCTAASSRVR